MKRPSISSTPRLVALLAGAFLLLQGFALGQTITDVKWTGAGGDSAWDNSANWDIGRVPGSDPTNFRDIVSLEGATVDLSTGDWEVGVVGESGGGALNITGGSLAVIGGTGGAGAQSNYNPSIAITLTGGTLQTLGDSEFRANGGFTIGGNASLIVGGDFRPHTSAYNLNGSGFSISATDYNTIGDTINWNLDAQGIGAFTISTQYRDVDDDWVFDLNAYDISNGTSLLLIDGPAGDTATTEPTTTFNFGSNPDILSAQVTFDQPNGDYYLEITPIPEPSALTLLLGTCGLLILLRRRR